MTNQVSNKTIEKLKYDLVRDKLVSFDDLTCAEEIADKKGKNLAQVLTEEGFIREEVFLKFIQDNLHIPYVNLRDYSLDEKCLGFISAKDAKKYCILPLFRIENVLTIAMADPLNLFVINNLVKCVQCNIEPVICAERQILEAIKKYYPEKQESSESGQGLIIDWREELDEETPDIQQVERIMDSITSQALLEKVFEVVFENTEQGLAVKFRKPGLTENKGVIPLLISPLCVSHIKNVCGLDSEVFDVPQVGKFTIKADIDYITCIVSTFPATNGERLSIKLYNPPKTLKELTLKPQEARLLKESLDKPGVILIAGPQLSGKSYFAYTILNSLDSANKNIMTVESLVKYDLPGVNQCELNEKIGFSIEKALEMIDFQSPDIVYVEEVLSGKLCENILALAKSGKLVITEINAAGSSELTESFSEDEIKEFGRIPGCIIIVRDSDNISVTGTLTG